MLSGSEKTLGECDDGEMPMQPKFWSMALLLLKFSIAPGAYTQDEWERVAEAVVRLRPRPGMGALNNTLSIRHPESCTVIEGSGLASRG